MEVCLKTNFTVRRVSGIRFPFFGKYDFFSLLQQQNLFRTIKDIEVSVDLQKRVIAPLHLSINLPNIFLEHEC